MTRWFARSELDIELGDAERRAVRADDVRADDLAAGLDEHLGVGVVETDLAADDVAGRESGDGQQVREIRQLREIDARRRRQHLDGAAAAPLQSDGQHVDGIADEVAVRIRDADEQRTRVGCRCRRIAGGWLAAGAAAPREPREPRARSSMTSEAAARLRCNNVCIGTSP